MKTNFNLIKKNKTILIISCVFPPEPVVSALLSKDIANELSKSHNVEVLHPKPTRPDGYVFTQDELIFNYESITTNSFTCPSYSLFGRLRESYSFGKKCARYINENVGNIDIIYLNAWALFAQYEIIKAAKQWNISCVTHIQDIYPESFTNRLPFVYKKILQSIFLPIDKFVLRNSKKVIAISGKMKYYLAKTRNINLNKIDVVNNWQDESTFIQCEQAIDENDSVKNSFSFMYLGNIGPVAGVELLIDAFNKANLQNAKLVIAGSGSMKEKLQSKCELLNNSNIEFCPVKEGKVPETQATADVMLLPIKKGAASSSIPSKLPAYMFSSKPIIACADSDSDTADAIRESDCGWIVEPENTDSLSEKMEEVRVMSKIQLEDMGKRGCEYALKQFSRRKNILKIVQIILNVKG